MTGERKKAISEVCKLEQCIQGYHFCVNESIKMFVIAVYKFSKVHFFVLLDIVIRFHREESTKNQCRELTKVDTLNEGSFKN